MNYGSTNITKLVWKAINQNKIAQFTKLGNYELLRKLLRIDEKGKLNFQQCEQKMKFLKRNFVKWTLISPKHGTLNQRKKHKETAM